MTLVNPEIPYIDAQARPDILARSLEIALETGPQVEARTMAIEYEEDIDASDEKACTELEMRLAVARFNTAVAMHEVVIPESRDTTVTFEDVDSEQYRVGEWVPNVKRYSSSDAWQEANPKLTEATSTMIESTMAVTRRLAGSHDPDLAYLDGKRANGGRKMTIVTEILADADETMGRWIKGLPSAEFLRPVASPWPDTPTILRDKKTGAFSVIESSPALLALTGGSGDGRAVREREAWERSVVAERFTANQLQDGATLRITSLGTGTGEPAMDSGLAVVHELAGDDGRVVVNGIDLNENSLKVAERIAELKRQQLDNPNAVTFQGSMANLLSREGLAGVVAGTKSHVYEAVGFAEYVPSDHATDPVEQQMRERMAGIGLLSAEDFYGTIYDNMPEGSVLITGNMRVESPQGDFVTDGLGWPGIIKRGTTEYLQILRRAGIPAEAVELFVPDEANSAAAYNLVAITKR